MAKREILFRGWNKKNKKWLYGYYCVNRGEHFIAPDSLVDVLASYEDYVVDEDTIGQYTGMKDAEGVKIFEGDIIGGDVCIHVIQYNEEKSRFDGVRPLPPERQHLSLLSQFDINQDWIDEYGKVIIGNVHEDSEIIKTEL